MPKIVVYIRAADARAIREKEQKDPAEWVRELVAYAVERWKEKNQ